MAESLYNEAEATLAVDKEIYLNSKHSLNEDNLRKIVVADTKVVEAAYKLNMFEKKEDLVLSLLWDEMLAFKTNNLASLELLRLRVNLEAARQELNEDTLQYDLAGNLTL